MDEKTLQRLVDRLDIQDTMTTYATAVDDRDFDLLRSVFADDAVAVYDKDSGPLSGGDTIVAWVEEATADLTLQQHMLSVYGVEIAGDEAKALVYLLSHQTVGSAPHTTRMMTSRYRNVLRRVDGRWLIAEINLRVGWYEERDFPQAAALEGSAPEEVLA